MAIADKKIYLAGLSNLLRKPWPENRTVNIVFHGHSVPSGYFATPHVDTFNAYPHIVHQKLKERFPFAVINIIITAIGGEDSVSGAKRFSKDVLCHRPDLVLIDYGLNDRKFDHNTVMCAWKQMVKEAKEYGSFIILLTPTWDISVFDPNQEYGKPLRQIAEIIRTIASEEEVGLVDSFNAFEKAVSSGIPPESLLSWVNHPNRQGHQIVANEIISWFPF